MASLMGRAQHLFGSEFDEVLMHSVKMFRVLQNRGRRGASGEDVDRMRGWISFYLSQGYQDRPERFFSIPKKPPEVAVIEQKPYSDGMFRVLSFRSGYAVRNPDFRDYFQSFEMNRTAYLLHWTHGDKGRKTIVCCHGWSLGDPTQAEYMFRISKLFNMGLDVALFISPLHWKRASNLIMRFSPPFPFEHPVLGLEGFGQAIHDLASSILFLKQTGASRVGIIGASLGGYIAALFVSLTPMAELATLVVPLISFNNLKVMPASYLPLERGKEGQREALQKDVSELWKIHSPLLMPCKLAPERCLLIASRGDKLCPFEDVQSISDHWGGPDHLFMRGGHALFFPRSARGASWYRFLKKNDFI